MVDFKKKLSSKKQALLRISELVEEYGELGDDISTKKKRQHEIREELGPLFLDTGEEEILIPSSDADSPDRKIKRTKGRRQLSKEKLVQNGVPVKTIEQSYSDGKPGFKVVAVKENGEEEGGED